MRDCVAVGAQRDQIRARIYTVVRAKQRYRNDMMNVDKTLSNGSEGRCETEVADLASGAVNFDTRRPVYAAAFVAVDLDPDDRTLG